MLGIVWECHPGGHQPLAGRWRPACSVSAHAKMNATCRSTETFHADTGWPESGIDRTSDHTTFVLCSARLKILIIRHGSAGVRASSLHCPHRHLWTGDDSATIGKIIPAGRRAGGCGIRDLACRHHHACSWRDCIVRSQCLAVSCSDSEGDQVRGGFVRNGRSEFVLRRSSLSAAMPCSTATRGASPLADFSIDDRNLAISFSPNVVVGTV